MRYLYKVLQVFIFYHQYYYYSLPEQLDQFPSFRPDSCPFTLSPSTSSLNRHHEIFNTSSVVYCQPGLVSTNTKTWCMAITRSRTFPGSQASGEIFGGICRTTQMRLFVSKPANNIFISLTATFCWPQSLPRCDWPWHSGMFLRYHMIDLNMCWIFLELHLLLSICRTNRRRRYRRSLQRFLYRRQLPFSPRHDSQCCSFGPSAFRQQCLISGQSCAFWASLFLRCHDSDVQSPYFPHKLWDLLR